jgi:hypothetical protein
MEQEVKCQHEYVHSLPQTKATVGFRTGVCGGVVCLLYSTMHSRKHIS